MTAPSRRQFLTAASAALALTPAAARARNRAAADETGKARNLILVTLDGLRPEEVFTGADEALMTKQAGVANVEALRKRFWRDTPESRREALLPFLWGTLAKQGQFYGNAARGSHARVTNGKNFSYPGYNEILSGAGDPRIDSNDKVPNPNVTVLEWLNTRPDFQGKVAAFGSWDTFPYILNAERGKFPVNAGWMRIGPEDRPTERQALLNRVSEHMHREWDNVRHDVMTFEAARDHLAEHHPRVLYIAFGETDDYAHEGRYDLYLDAAHRTDRMIADLWGLAESLAPEIGPTALLITTDHGRGPAPDGWKNHGANVPGADYIWIAALGAGVPALGERTDAPDVTQSQVAATAAALLGEDFRADHPKAAPPIAEAIGPKS